MVVLFFLLVVRVRQGVGNWLLVVVGFDLGVSESRALFGEDVDGLVGMDVVVVVVLEYCRELCCLENPTIVEIFLPLDILWMGAHFLSN